MRTQFTGFYTTPEHSLKNIWNSNSTLFIFDTNCLLNLYRCEEQTREEILEVMRKISARTWIPFQVGFEYQRNRRTVIKDSIDSLEGIKLQLEEIYKKDILGKLKKHLYSALNDEVSNLQYEIKKTIDVFIKEKINPRIEKKKNISAHDSIRSYIDEILEDRVGSVPTQQIVDTINHEGEKRYANKIPPGFEDAKKPTTSFFRGIKFEDKYGDLYLWNEIIDKAKSPHIKDVIFICDDNKKDWWFIHEGLKHGHLESLKTEICSKADIEDFIMINQSTFLLQAGKYVKGINISATALKEVGELSISKHYLVSNFNAENFEKIAHWMEENFTSLSLDAKNKKIHIKDSTDNKHRSDFDIDTLRELTNEISNTLDLYRKVIRSTISNLDDLDINKDELIPIIGDEQYKSLLKSITSRQSLVSELATRLKILHTKLVRGSDVSIEELRNTIHQLEHEAFLLHKQNEHIDSLLVSLL